MKLVAPSEIQSRSWAEISVSALQANAGVVKKYCPKAEMIAVIKADAYGHGAVVAARALASFASYFAVANVAEARELRQAGTSHPLLILSPVLPNERAEVVREKWIPSISTLTEIESYAALATGEPFSINLKVDTGMGRSGVLLEEATALLQEVGSFPNLNVRQISTHLPSPDSDEDFTRAQLEKFAQFVQETRRHFPKTVFHALNSAGILRFPAYAQELVRPGLMLYGASPIPEFQAELTPVCTWKTQICLLRDLPAGHGVSYGSRFVTAKPTRTALLPVGYADGYPRSLSGSGAEVLIHRTRCPILGIVTMDLIVVDVSEISDAQIGDEVVLLGSQGAETITAQELADKAGTIPWEILTGIQDRVTRVTVDKDSEN